MTGLRDAREVVREEPLVRGAILAAVAESPRTIPEIAAAIGRPEREVVFWVMAMCRFGYLKELKEGAPEGYFCYRAAEGGRR